MMRVKPLLTLSSVLLMFALAMGCSSSDSNRKDDSETRTSAASNPVCDEAMTACRENCEQQAAGDTAARGPCLNNCMRKAHDCNKNGNTQ